jgi:hypothetical protein
MPTGCHSIKYGGITLEDGTFAVVEMATIVNNDKFGIKLNLMRPITKDVELDDAGNVTAVPWFSPIRGLSQTGLK